MALQAQKHTREVVEAVGKMPMQISSVLDELRDGEMTVRISNPGVDDLAHHIDVSVNRIAVALVVLGGLIGSSLIGVLADDGPKVLGLHLISVVGFVLAGAFGVWLLWGIFRSGRL
jgi:ubiquinone biosynthesis protein